MPDATGSPASNARYAAENSAHDRAKVVPDIPSDFDRLLRHLESGPVLALFFLHHRKKHQHVAETHIVTECIGRGRELPRGRRRLSSVSPR